MSSGRLTVNIAMAVCAAMLGAVLALNWLTKLPADSGASGHVVLSWSLVSAIGILIVAVASSIPALRDKSVNTRRSAWSLALLALPLPALIWSFEVHHADVTRFAIAETLMFTAGQMVGSLLLATQPERQLDDWREWIAGRGRLLLWTTSLYGLIWLAVAMALSLPAPSIAYSMGAGFLVGLALAAAPRRQRVRLSASAPTWNQLAFDGLSARLSAQLQDLAQIDTKLGLIISLVAIVAAIVYIVTPSTLWGRVILGMVIGWPLILATLVMVRPGSKADTVSIDTLVHGAKQPLADFRSQLFASTLTACRRNDLLIDWKTTCAGAAVIALFVMVSILIGLRLAQLLWTRH